MTQTKVLVLILRLGKQWHAPKSAFRPKAGNASFEKRQEERKAMATVKAKEKEAERQVSAGMKDILSMEVFSC